MRQHGLAGPSPIGKQWGAFVVTTHHVDQPFFGKYYSKANAACADHSKSCLALRSPSKPSETQHVPKPSSLHHSTTLSKLDNSSPLAPRQRHHRMAGSTSRHGSMVETQPSGSYPSYFNFENMSVMPMVQYVDRSDHRYISSIFAGDNYNTPLPYNIWPIETAGEPDMPFADATTSLIAPTNYLPVPLPSPLSGTVPTASDEWQVHVDSSMQRSTGMPWDFAPQIGSDSINNSITPARSSEADPPNIQDYKAANTFLSKAMTDLSRPEKLLDSLPDGLARRRRMSRAAGSNEATRFKTDASRRGVSPAYNIDLLQTPISPVSDGGSSTPGIDDQTSPRRPGSSRRASSSGDTQRDLRSLSPAPRPKQLRRNRTAANKCRAKSKAAAAELEATERAGSLRREQLWATFRSLQAEVFALKSEILLHGNCGDVMIQNYLNSAAGSLATSYGGAAEWAPGGGRLSIPDPRYMQSPP